MIPLLCPLMAHAATYYVSDPTNAATDAANRAVLAPDAAVFPTMQAAEDNAALAPGDVVYVMNGTYGSNPKYWSRAVLVVTKPGTPNKPITFMAYPGHHPVIVTSGNSAVMSDIEIDASWITIQGFEMIGKAKDLTLDQATAAIAAQQAAYATSIAAGSPVTPFSISADVSCLSINKQTHITISRNIIHDCSASGISIEQSDYISVSANTVYNTSWWTEFDTSAINIHRAMNSDTYTGYKFRVYNNVVYNNGNTQPYYLDAATNPTAQPTDGNGIIVDLNQQTNDGKPYVGRTLILANLLFNNGGSGAHAYQSAHVDFINNTAFNNNTCPVAGSTCGNMNEGQIFGNVSNDVTFYNNIMVAPAGKYAFSNWKSTAVAEDYNLFGAQPIWKGYAASAHDIVADPCFKNVTRTTQMPDFRLHQDSPARDAGIKNLPGLALSATSMDGNLGAGIALGALSAP